MYCKISHWKIWGTNSKKSCLGFFFKTISLKLHTLIKYECVCTAKVCRKKIWGTNAQNFYVLKIHLNLFKISNHIWNFFIQAENLFQTWLLWIDTMWMYLALSHDKLEYTHIAPFCRVHIWNRFWGGIKLFQIWALFSNFKTLYEIQKTRWFWNLASVTSKMTSKPQQ